MSARLPPRPSDFTEQRLVLSQRSLWRRWVGALSMLAGALLLLTACTEDVVVDTRNAFPMGQADRFDQPVPTKLLFGQPVMTAKDYMPVALADIREPLPPAVPLPSAKDVEAASSSTEGRSDGGAVNPAAGQAAAISDGQGEGGKHELGAPQ